jgi:hypothetical protein
MGGEMKKGSEERPRRSHFRIPVRRMKPWDQGRETRHRTKNPVLEMGFVGVKRKKRSRNGDKEKDYAMQVPTKKIIMRCTCIA